MSSKYSNNNNSDWLTIFLLVFSSLLHTTYYCTCFTIKNAATHLKRIILYNWLLKLLDAAKEIADQVRG